ncbi:DUF4041 domain-containing protein [Vibrio mediterranei]|uniref:DUF4041 domain-containing protein n=1 Tax=Vibrio mediterranei TaxID=689 RepID=A0A3G4VA90_9VIBR|nr:DUF4041 domain-containing protein [Vibrio mediterranei]AYV20502.1 DUF4041 domain-containing protein [Vibrio mediterranei]
METTKLAIIIGVLLIALFLLYRKAKQLQEQNQAFETRFKDVIDADKERDAVLQEKEQILHETKELIESYNSKREVYERLKAEVAIYENDLDMIHQGFYEPVFDFDTSELFKKQIKSIKDEQRQMVKDKLAIYCNTNWTVGDSKAEGRKMINKAIRLTARAFNNECDAAIANVKWNNVDNMIKRIEKAFEAINKLNESNDINISYEYLELKIIELQCTYEYSKKKQEEKEEQAEIKRQMREEAKLEKEMAKALKEEEQFEKMLKKAQEEAERASGDKLDKLLQKIALLNSELEEAHAKSERAKSMAEQTKVGHVYVISNIGSFGEDVYKIGMTRRLEPMERVKELGDASVPFTFDVHAMIYSENAPALENALHKQFDFNRLNLVNNRKEFFAVNLKDIEEEVAKIDPQAEFIETAEAKEYRESKAIRLKRADLEKAQEVQVDHFPEMA